jgi:hypothetical protein
MQSALQDLSDIEFYLFHSFLPFPVEIRSYQEERIGVQVEQG